MLRHPCILGDPQRQPMRATKSAVVPNKGEQNQKWILDPCLLAGAEEGRNATPPLHSRGSPTPSAQGAKIKGGPNQRETKSELAASLLPSKGPKIGWKCYATPAFSGITAWGQKISSGPKQRGTKSEVATSPKPSRGPKRGRKCYVTPAFLGIPNAKRAGSKKSAVVPTKQNKIRSGCLTHAFSGVQKRAEMLRHPCILGDPQRQPRREQKISSGPKQRETKLEVAASPLPSRGAKKGQKCYVTPAFSGIPNANQWEQKISSGPKQRGTKLEVATLPLPSRGPKRGWKCYVTPAFSGIPNTKHGEQKIRSGPKPRKTRSEVATSPLPSQGTKNGQKCYVTHAFPGIPNAKHGEEKFSCGPKQRGTK